MIMRKKERKHEPKKQGDDISPSFALKCNVFEGKNESSFHLILSVVSHYPPDKKRDEISCFHCHHPHCYESFLVIKRFFHLIHGNGIFAILIIEGESFFFFFSCFSPNFTAKIKLQLPPQLQCQQSLHHWFLLSCHEWSWRRIRQSWRRIRQE